MDPKGRKFIIKKKIYSNNNNYYRLKIGNCFMAKFRKSCSPLKLRKFVGKEVPARLEKPK
jgi:hypothetical protein